MGSFVANDPRTPFSASRLAFARQNATSPVTMGSVTSWKTDYELRTPSSAGDWAEYHRIRRTILWETRGLLTTTTRITPTISLPNSSCITMSPLELRALTIHPKGSL